MTASGYLWGLPAPTRLVPSAVPAITQWCRDRQLRRPMLVGGRSLTTAPQGLGVVHALEGEGLAVWAFDRATAPSLVTVADAVAAYHFEDCDSLVAIGGAVATEVAKAVALMVGQHSPYRSLASEPGADGEAVDAAAVPPLLAVPTTPAAALATGGAVWIADDAGVARPLRHPALRPREAILAADLTAAVPDAVAVRSRDAAALMAWDAEAAAGDVEALLAADDADRAMQAALRLSGDVEGASAPRRRLALTAALATGADFAGTMAALTPSVAALEAVVQRLAPASPVPIAPAVARAVRDACGPGDAAALDRVLEHLRIELNDGPRRRGRRGRVA